MKIKVKELTLEEVEKLPERQHKRPLKPNILFRTLLKVLSIKDLTQTKFKCNKINMEKLGKKEPCLILMNHSSFIDLKIASSILYPRPFNIICTSDGFVGKEWLMYHLGCVPTNKFVTDATLVRDMLYCLKKIKSSVLMFPEAGYSFDGTATQIPDTLGKLIKTLKVPVVMVKTYGAFSRDPLYNNLQLRKVNVSADLEYLLTKKQIEEKSQEELNKIIKQKFTFDSFKWQQDNKIKISEHFRADSLNRVLYQCPHCLSEGKMLGKGITIKCNNCNIEYELTEYGYLKCLNGQGIFNHIPDWFTWQREYVKNELLENRYFLNINVDIYILKDTKYLYKVGIGHLTHNKDGLKLIGCNGKLNFEQPATASYSLNSDYYWYEIGDVICLGTNKCLYYCFPQNCGDIVTKTRLACEELYKITKS